jgi:IS5 family transposase
MRPKERVFIARQRRGLTPTIKRELRRRSAIEPMIGHMKQDGRLERNHLLGARGMRSMRCWWPPGTTCD